MFKISNLNIVNHPILNNLSIDFSKEIEKNELKYVTLIIGENGTGKTQVLKCLVDIFLYLSNQEERWQRSYDFEISIYNGVELQKFSSSELKGADLNKYLPKKVLTSSYTFNDPFPKVDHTPIYYYGGLKTAGNNIFINKPAEDTFYNLCSILTRKQNIETLNKLFEELNFRKKIKVVYSSRRTNSKLFENAEFQNLLRIVSENKNVVERDIAARARAIILNTLNLADQDRKRRFQDNTINRVIYNDSDLYDVLKYLARYEALFEVKNEKVEIPNLHTFDEVFAEFFKDSGSRMRIPLKRKNSFMDLQLNGKSIIVYNSTGNISGPINVDRLKHQYETGEPVGGGMGHYYKYLVMSLQDKAFEMAGQIPVRRSTKENILPWEFEYSWDAADKDDHNNLIFEEHLRYYELLSDLDVVSFDSFMICKNDFFDFKDASSGEFHFLHLIAGILANIRAHSLVIIDEPEISFHVTWQNKFFNFLRPIIDAYDDSHFIIASHSHFLVSELDSNNSEIIALCRQGKEVLVRYVQENGGNTLGWSAEQILFDVFQMPTDRNFYLSGIIEDIVCQMSAPKPDKKIIERNIEKLKGFSLSNLSARDPLKSIIENILSNELDRI